MPRGTERRERYVCISESQSLPGSAYYTNPLSRRKKQRAFWMLFKDILLLRNLVQCAHKHLPFWWLAIPLLWKSQYGVGRAAEMGGKRDESERTRNTSSTLGTGCGVRRGAGSVPLAPEITITCFPHTFGRVSPCSPAEAQSTNSVEQFPEPRKYT